MSPEEALENLHLLDRAMAREVASAQTQGSVLRHVASLDAKGHASVRLAMLPASHPFAHSRLTDNIVQFTTHRYRDNPMLVQGPGAGPEVTAAGIFADLLRIAESLEVR
jgi:aspartokinase/homoserine dehydrogenase 1